MALFCKKCKKQLMLTSYMRTHVITCYGDERKWGIFADEWEKAELSPMTMFELYFQTEDPKTAQALINKKAKDVIWDALYHDGIRPSVKIRLQGMLSKPIELASFECDNFKDRMAISGTVANPTIYYRKMSDAEWIASRDSGKKPFETTFKFMNSDNYRYWVSSSLSKVQAFGNENATDMGGVIVRITFTSSPLSAFTVSAHQEVGVQTNPKVVAIHREGFAEIGSVASKKDVEEIVKPTPMLDYNLGFTSDQSKQMTTMLSAFDRI
jgi:hypothetical protein